MINAEININFFNFKQFHHKFIYFYIFIYSFRYFLILINKRILNFEKSIIFLYLGFFNY